MAELYILDSSDNLLTTLTEETGLISAPFREELNRLPDQPFSFTIEADVEEAKYVVDENQVVFKDKDGDLRLYVIKELDEIDNHDGPQTTAICEPGFMELKEHVVVDRRFTDQTADVPLNAALVGSRWIGEVDAELGLRSTNFYYLYGIDAIWKIISVWGGEFKDVVEFDGQRITARKIKLLQLLGADKGKRFEIDYDVEEIQRTVLSYPVTSLYGRGTSLETEGGGNTRFIDFSSVEWSVLKGDPVDKPLGQRWIGDPEALLKYGREHNGQLLHREGIWQDGDIEDPAELLQATWEQLQKVKKPEINYRLTVQLLEFIAGYEHEKVSLGDTTRAIDRRFSRPIEIQSRVIALEYDLLDIEGTAVVEMGQFLSVHEYDDRIDKVVGVINNKSGIWDRGGGPITDERFPDILPDTPSNFEANGGFQTVILSWDFNGATYIKEYEVYASEIKGFLPTPETLVYRGKGSGYNYQGETNKQYYFRVRAVNYHGKASPFSAEVSATTVRIITDDMLFGSVNKDILANLAVEASKLANGAVTESKLFDQAVTNAKMAANAVKELQIANLAVGNSKLAELAVTAEKLVNGAVGTNQLANTAVNNSKLADLAVDALKLANSAVTPTKLANLAVGTAAIANLAVVNGKLDNLSVGSAQLQNLSVTEAKMAALSVGSAAIQNLAVKNQHVDRLSADKVTIGSSTIFATNYDPTTKETPTGAQSKANTARDEAIVYTDLNTGNLVNNPTATGVAGRWSTTTMVNHTFEGLSVPVLQSSVSSDTQHFSDYFDIDPSKAYEVSLWIKKSANAGRIYMGLSGLDSAGNGVGFDQVSDVNGSVSANNTNFYFYSSTFVPTEFMKIVGYIMPSGTLATDMIGIGENASVNARFRPNTRRVRVRFLNWGNAGTTRQVWVANPKVQEVDPQSVIKAANSNRLSNLWKYENTTFIDGGNIYLNTITANQIATATITAASGILADASVGSANIINLAVGNAALANAVVTNGKIGTLAVSTGQIQDLAVTRGKIANLAIDNAKIADATITSAKIANLTADKITSGILSSVTINVSTDATIGRTLYLGSLADKSNFKSVFFNESAYMQGGKKFNIDTLLANADRFYINPTSFGRAQLMTDNGWAGFCGVGGQSANTTTSSVAGVGVDFPVKPSWTPSSISLNTLTSNFPNNINVTDINDSGFWLYINGTGTAGAFPFWRGFWSF